MKIRIFQDSKYEIANTGDPHPQTGISWSWFLPAMLAVLYFLSPVAGVEIDRILVSVNGTVITEGDLDLAVKLNELILYGKNTAPRSRSEELNRLIDLELLRQELTNFSLTPEDESKVEERIRSLRDLHANQGGLDALLARLGLQESELRSYLRLESSILKFVDFRFRPFASVSSGEIKAYYDGTLAAQLKKEDVSLPPLSQVAARIEAILREEKINASLDQWVQGIRRNSRIEYFQKP